MNVINRSKAVLDACVLYPAPLRDILLHLAIQNTYLPHWTTKINDEWKRNLLEKRFDISTANINRTIKLMNLAQPSANVSSFEHLIPTLTLPDKDDRHVLAAAIVSKSDYIVTFNLKDFPNTILEKFNIQAIHPDEFICSLFEKDEASVSKALNNQVAFLKNPPKSQKEVLTMLEKCGLKQFAQLF